MGKGQGKKRKHGGGSWQRGDGALKKRRGPEPQCFRGFLFTTNIPRNVPKAGGDIASLLSDPELDPKPDKVVFENGDSAETKPNHDTVTAEKEAEENNVELFDVADELAAEIAELRGEQKNDATDKEHKNIDKKSGPPKKLQPQFRTLDICKGVGFVQLRNGDCGPYQNKGISNFLPSKRWVHGLNLALEEERKISRCLGRVHPIDRASKPHLKEFTQLLETHLLKHVEDLVEEKGKSYRLCFTSRNMSTIKQKDVMELVFNILGKDYFVSSCDADVTILVEVVPHFAGFAVVKDYEKLKEFQVRQIFSHIADDFV